MKTRTERVSNNVSGTNLEHARSHNRRVVIEAIRLNGQLTRADIARLTSLSSQTVSNIVAELLDAGMLLASSPLKEGGRGQPAIPLSLNPDGAYSIGVQLDHQILIAVVVDLAGQVRGRVECPVDRPSPQVALPLIADLILGMRKTVTIDWRRVLGMGLVMAGPFGVEGMSSQGPTTLPGWNGVPVTELLQQSIGLPVLLGNDAQAVAIGERLHGIAKTLQNFVYLFIGTGLGAGLFLDGRLYKGAGRNAGEVGHMIVVPDGRLCYCGNRGCLERYVSLHAAYEALNLPDPSRGSPDLLLPGRDDQQLERWLDSAVPPLRRAVNILESLLDVDGIVIGGLLPQETLNLLVQRLDPLPVSICSRRNAEARILIGAAGIDTAALGAAALPLFDEFNPQYEVLLKQG